MKLNVFWLGVVTIIGFGGLGLAIVHWVQGESIYELILGNAAFWVQVTVGLGAGVSAALLAFLVIQAPFFRAEFDYYTRLIGNFSWTPAAIGFVSVCAGVGEELFFRAGMQPILGVFWTSVLFVAVHGYLNPFNWRISVYGVLMVGMIAGFGWLYSHFGIWSASIAHAVFDIVIITGLLRHANKTQTI